MNHPEITQERIRKEKLIRNIRRSQPDIEWPEELSTCREQNPSPADTGERQIILCEGITPPTSMRVITELLRYESAEPGVPIHMHLFSPGGCVVSGLAVIDTMRNISSPVFTYSVGYAASMAAVILACGEKDHRYILPHSRVMIHQASGSAGGSLDNLRATLEFQNNLEEDCDALLAGATGRTIEEIRNASRVDNWMRAEVACNFGLVDHILEAS